jgi:hypothetical protein
MTRRTNTGANVTEVKWKDLEGDGPLRLKNLMPYFGRNLKNVRLISNVTANGSLSQRGGWNTELPRSITIRKTACQ